MILPTVDNFNFKHKIEGKMSVKCTHFVLKWISFATCCKILFPIQILSHLHHFSPGKVSIHIHGCWEFYGEQVRNAHYVSSVSNPRSIINVHVWIRSDPLTS